MKLTIQYLVLTVLCFYSSQVILAINYSAKNEIHFDNYIIYYNTFPSISLEPRIASAVGIKRSSSRNVLTIVVKRRLPGRHSEQSVKANISGRVYTLMGHVREITLQEVKDGDAIYYVGDFTALDRENFTFKLSVQPEGVNYSKDFEFKRGLYSH